jgi:hypothetical protein
MAGAVVYAISLLALEHGTLLEIPWFTSTQKQLFSRGFGTGHATWLRPDCIVPDPELIYRPKIGSCRFDTIEFRTTLSFTGTGRFTGTRPAGKGIAVIGDSHAMGWGVNDLETFSARLQALTGRPVYNLGVASYGTIRELIWLENSGVLDRVDTVIIQYCNNDFHENTKFDTAAREQLGAKLFGQFERPETRRAVGLSLLVEGYGLALKAPFSALASKVRRKNFRRHYDALVTVIARHVEALRDKRVIVFYSNPHGERYRNYPAGRDSRFPNLNFVDIDLGSSDYYRLDSHPTPTGHRKIAERLFGVLRTGR